jgi:predicted GNAT family acetyltransferase
MDAPGKSMMRDNLETHRFEIDVSGQVVFANYRRDDGVLFIDHVEAPPSLRGTGAAGALMQAIVEQARAEKRTIVPVCGYAAAWLRRHAAI